MKAFRHLKILFSATLLFCICACAEHLADPLDPDPVPTDIPQIVESELLDIAGRDWKSLLDTLIFFKRDMLDNGRTEGTGSDGVYYSLKAVSSRDTATVRFSVQDSLWLTLKSTFMMRHLEMYACGVTVTYDHLQDSIRISAQNISAVVPDVGILSDDVIIPVEYRHEGVGYIGFDYFENTDYTVKRYPVMYYYGDTRSFGFYENLHFLELLDQSNQLVESVR